MSSEERKSKINQFEISNETEEIISKNLNPKKEKYFIKIIIFLTSIALCFMVYQIIEVSSITSDKNTLEKENKILLNELNKMKENYQIFTPSETNFTNKELLDNIFYPYSSDIITSIEELNFLRHIFGRVRIRIEYKSSIHGATVEKFRERSKQHNHQLILIKTKKGNRFGGYTSDNFEPIKLAEISMEAEKMDPTAFLFNLDSKKIFNVKEDKFALFCEESLFANFGGEDLIIFDNFKETKGLSQFPDHFGDQNSEKGELTGGEHKFDIEEIEVFHINFFYKDFQEDYDRKGRYGKRNEKYSF